MCYDAHKASSRCTNLYISSSYKSPLLHWYCSPSTSQTFLASTSSLCLFRCFDCFPILSEPVLLPPTAPSYIEYVPPYPFNTSNGLHYQSINQLTRAETVTYSDNSLWHKPLHLPNMASSNLCRLLIRNINHCTYQICQSSNLRR